MINKTETKMISRKAEEFFWRQKFVHISKLLTFLVCITHSLAENNCRNLKKTR